jgi:hypothetical protein
MFIGGGNGYKVYDLENKIIKEVKESETVDTRNLSSPADDLDGLHIQNFLSGISSGTKLISPISEGYKSTLLCQLGNIALRSGNSLKIDTTNGHIINDPVAQEYWSRKYQPGWEPVI